MPPELTPEQFAQELIDRAWEEEDEAERMRLVLRALARSPDHADGYVLLAQQVDGDLVAVRELYERGVAAGERALGTSIFAREVGSFWGLIQTRPYMRARHGLALTLWKLGEQTEAIAHLQEMLRLNPHDNQGVRYNLTVWLFETGAGDELERLFGAYRDDASAEWAYTRALWTFRLQGASRHAAHLVREAYRWNPHVPAYLTDPRRLPKQLPFYISLGQESEAIAYAAHAGHLWPDQATAPFTHSGSIGAKRPTLRGLSRESRLLGWVGPGDGQPQACPARAHRRLAAASAPSGLDGADSV